MTGTITLINSISVEHGTFKFPLTGSSQLKVTQTKQGGGSPGYLLIGTSGTNLNLSAFNRVGWCRIVNLDANAYLQIGPYSGSTYYPFAVLKPGESCQFRIDPNISNLRLRLDPTTTVDPDGSGSSSGSGDDIAKVQVFIFED